MNPLVRFLLRRIGTGFFVLFGITFLTFILAHLVPIDPVAAWVGKTAGANPQLVELYREKYHLNDPLYIQYFYYLYGLLHGDLGFSPAKGEPVSQVISETLPYTLQLVFVAMIFVIILGTITGLLAAKYAGKPADRFISGFYIFGVASPPFFVPLILIIIFSLFLPILPTGGQIDLLIKLPTPIVGIPIIDALIEGNWTALGSLLTHILLPSLSLALGYFGILTRILRSSTLQQLDSNFIRAARARGVSENKIFFKYAFKNSLISVITLVSLLTIFLVGSDIFVESIFAYPGMGQYAVQAALTIDYPGILGTTLIFGIIIVILNLAADLLYAAVDPRIRYS